MEGFPLNELPLELAYCTEASSEIVAHSRAKATKRTYMIQSDKTVLVTGATGRQGGAVVRHMLPKGWKLRALTRRPGGQEAKSLARQGVEVVQGDLAQGRSHALRRRSMASQRPRLLGSGRET